MGVKSKNGRRTASFELTGARGGATRIDAAFGQRKKIKGWNAFETVLRLSSYVVVSFARRDVVDSVLRGDATRWREKTYGLMRRVSDAERRFERDISSSRFERARGGDESRGRSRGRAVERAVGRAVGRADGRADGRRCK